ncbi:MAG: 1-acyl-sn-glycerol-3-phosphate acyltransferase [Alphaproteobacteria bacterium]|nr:1-acyl-sn-glycerol-3-phosphate acyltransferase [Alphaproteobacteria bacterium]MBR1953703.1 1-acyl-sn-glycerol-3-phosphate acyltransferase [Alphaproteobacteria bacterium]
MAKPKIRKQNIFNTTTAAIKFVLFWVMVVIQLPILILLPRRWAVQYMPVFMWVLVKLGGIKIVVHGKISDARPLMVVSNHISVFEIATFPFAFRGSFIAKKEMENWPLVGWVAKKFGVIFVDRRPSHARDALAVVQKTVQTVKYPMILFPEGTTTNGAYVKPFKSTLFNFVENSNVTVQPMAMHYRYKDGTPIDEQTLADHFAYFDNAKMDMGPRCKRERSAFGQVFHIMMLGGFMVEITLLPPPPLAGMDRKQIADVLHKIVSEKYMELKDKNNN